MVAPRHGDVPCAIPALEGLRQEDHKREDSLSVVVSFLPRKGRGSLKDQELPTPRKAHLTLFYFCPSLNSLLVLTVTVHWEDLHPGESTLPPGHGKPTKGKACDFVHLGYVVIFL